MRTGRHLRELSCLERRDALEELVVEYLRQFLSMGEGEEFSVDRSYFDIGLTSLSLTEARDYLQELLGVDIDATVLFNQPTVEQLVIYLADALPDPSSGKEASDAA